MRECIGFIIILLTFLVFASSVEAQLLNRLKDRAKNAAENKVEQKIGEEVERKAERMVESYWNSIFGENERSGEGFNMPFSLNSNAVTEESYIFDVVTSMEIETINEDGNSDPPVKMQMHFNEQEMYTGTKISGEDMSEEEGEMFIIYDLKNESMVMLMDSEDGKFSFAYDWKQAQQFVEEYADAEYAETEDNHYDTDEEVEMDDWNGFEKIGTKIIAGLECQGYESKTEDTRMEWWVTNDAEFGIHNALRINSHTKELKGKVPDDYPSGMLMEMVNEDMLNGSTTIMRVTDINKNANVSYMMDDYPAMTFGK